MGLSFSIEGSEAAGKTLLSSLTRILFEETTDFPVLATREPGGTPVGEKIRAILKAEEFKGMHPITNVLLFSASRSELLFGREIPFLTENPHGILLKDRSYLSTKTLQTVDGVSMKYINNVQLPFTEIPDKFAIIDIPVLETVARMTAIQKTSGNREVDWRDTQTMENLEKIRGNYLSFAATNRDKCIILDCFDDPWIKAARIKLEAYRVFGEREGKLPGSGELKELYTTFVAQAEEITLNHKTWISGAEEMKKTFDIYGLRDAVEEARAELGYPGREELQAEMHQKWNFMGLEGFSGGIEREK